MLNAEHTQVIGAIVHMRDETPPAYTRVLFIQYDLSCISGRMIETKYADRTAKQIFVDDEGENLEDVPEYWAALNIHE